MEEAYYRWSTYHFAGNNPVSNIDPNGMDYWSTSDPDEITRFLNSIQWGMGGFQSFNYSGWNHATDAEFTGNLTYNDETNMFYSSYGTIRDDVVTSVGISIPGIVNSDNGSVGILSEAGANWLDRSTGRTGTPLIDPIDIVAGGLGSLKALFTGGFVRSSAKTVTKELPTQIHHFATNKHSVFTKQMSAIAEKYRLDLNEAWNKAAMSHLGKHPNEYHRFVLQSMEKASMEAGGNQAKFLQLFDQYVKQPVLQNPSLLRKSGW